MSTRTHNSGWSAAAMLFVLAAAHIQAYAQTPAAPVDVHSQSRAKSQGQVTAAPSIEDATKAPQGILVDQVIAVVNGDLILESDVDEERRFGAFQPFRETTGDFSRDEAIERLIDRTLILEQARLQPGTGVTPAEATAQLQTMRKDIPACKQFHCETDAGWEKFVSTQGFTVPLLTERWQQRMEILKFVEVRFRAGIHITPEEIKDYYDKKLLPEYARQKAAAPALDSISDRIQEVLLQQRVTNLLSDWLTSLKAEGTVRVMRPGEVEP